LEAPVARARAIRSYEDLEVYQRAMALLPQAHRLALSLPDFEKHDLADQMRRASKAIPANIAEGYGKRRSAKEFKAYLTTALGSTNEMLVHLKIAASLDYVAQEHCNELIAAYTVVGKQLCRLIQRWQ
jgi:four helix bundle protein